MVDLSGRQIVVELPSGFDDLMFAEMYGGDQISAPFEFQLRVVGEDQDKDAYEILGKPIGVEVIGENFSRFFHGFVTQFGLDNIDDGLAQYSITLRPWLWFLSNRRDCRIFQKLSVVEIIEQVFSAYPNANYDIRLGSSYDPREYCVQYDECDLDFVQRLMEHEGIFYFFEYAQGVHKMVIADANNEFKSVPDFDEVKFQSDTTRGSEEPDYISEWSTRAMVRSGAYAHVDYDFTKPPADLMSLAKKKIGYDQDDAEVYAHPGSHQDLGRGDDVALLRLQELQAGQVTTTARGSVRGLWSGAKFKLTEFPRESENTDHVVLGATYRMWDEQYAAGMGSSPQDGFKVELVVSPHKLPFRAMRKTPIPVMRGPQTATVVGPTGEEIFTDEFSRVKVQFHWDRLGGDDEQSSCFIRVSSAWAGAGWGFIQIPRIGQEVIVDFVEGDPDKPIITGRVYNNDQMPPYELPANATQSGWKSNSTPGGGGFNELRFEDKAGAEEVYFQAQKDHTELVKNDENRTIQHDMNERVDNISTQSIGVDRHEEVGNNKTTKVGVDRDVEIGSNDTEKVGSNRSLNVGIDETISVGGNSSESIGANHSQTVGATQTITVKAARVDMVGAAESRAVALAQTQTVGASRTVQVAVSQSHDIGASDSLLVGADQTISIGAGQTLEVSADQDTKIGGAQSLSVAKDQSNEIAGARASKVAKGDATNVGEDMAIDVGKSLAITAADQVSIVCGSSALVMKKDGTINLEGKDLTLKGSGKITLDASGDVTIKGSKINQN